jgi:hypothetical protein
VERRLAAPDPLHRSHQPPRSRTTPRNEGLRNAALDRYFQPFRYFATRYLLETGLDFVLTGNPRSVMRKVAAAHPAR